MNSVDLNHLIDTISFSAKFLAITVVVSGLLKIALTQYFLLKITEAKKTEIKFTKDEKTASYTNYEDNAEKVVKMYKDYEDIDVERFTKAS